MDGKELTNIDVNQALAKEQYVGSSIACSNVIAKKSYFALSSITIHRLHYAVSIVQVFFCPIWFNQL